MGYMLKEVKKMLGLKAKMIAALGGIIALIGIAITFFYKGKKAKAIEVEAKTAKTVIKVIKKDKEVEKTIDRMSPDTRRNKLRRYASDTD